MVWIDCLGRGLDWGDEVGLSHGLFGMPWCEKAFVQPLVGFLKASSGTLLRPD